MFPKGQGYSLNLEGCVLLILICKCKVSLSTMIFSIKGHLDLLQILESI